MPLGLTFIFQVSTKKQKKSKNRKKRREFCNEPFINNRRNNFAKSASWNMPVKKEQKNNTKQNKKHTQCETLLKFCQLWTKNGT